MTDDSGDRTDDGLVADLDRLGTAAVAEAPEVPPAPQTSPVRRTRLLAAAAVLVLVAGGATAFAIVDGRDDGSQDLATSPASTTITPSGPAVADRWPIDDMVEMTFSPSPAPANGLIEVTVENHTEADWSFDCHRGQLARWDGESMQEVSSDVIWEGQELLIDDVRDLQDCVAGSAVLAPGATEVRSILIPMLDVRNGGRYPLEPGTYQLLFVDGGAFTGAVGEFEVTASPSAEEQELRDGCDLLSRDELVDLTGVQPDAAVDHTEIDAAGQSCALIGTDQRVRYSVVDVPPDRLGTMGAGTASEGIGDESFIRTSLDRSGLWMAEGGVRVGDRAVTVGIETSRRGSDTYPPSDGDAVEPGLRATTAALLRELADRL